MAASLFLLERYRWYSLSFGSHPLSAHQSAATLCHSLRVSVSAFWMYHLRVSLLIDSLPLKSKGTMAGGSFPRSERWTGILRTSRHPMRSLSSFGSAQNASDLQ